MIEMNLLCYILESTVDSYEKRNTIYIFMWKVAWNKQNLKLEIKHRTYDCNASFSIPLQDYLVICCCFFVSRVCG